MATERWAKNGGCAAKNGGENEEGTNERARERKCVKQSELAAGGSLGQRGTPWEGCRACRLAGMDVWRQSERRAHNLLAAAGLGQSQWPMSSSKKSNILTKAKLHTYVEL